LLGAPGDLLSTIGICIAAAALLALVGRLVASSIRDKHEDDETISFRFRALTITTKPRVAVVADKMPSGRLRFRRRSAPRERRPPRPTLPGD